MEGENQGDEKQPSDNEDDEESKEKEKNILKSLPSRRIASWKLKSNKRKNSTLRKQKSLDGRVYMPVDNDASDHDDSVLVDVDEVDALAGKEGKYIETKSLTERLEERRRLRSTSLSPGTRSLSCFTAIRYGIAMSFKMTYQRVKDFLQMFGLWRGHFKEIEGSFGNGIVSFFTFLRWLLYVNMLLFIIAVALLVIPQAVHTGQVSAVIVGPAHGNTSINSSNTADQPINYTTVKSVNDIIKSQAGFLGANTSLVAQQQGCAVFKINVNPWHNVGATLSDFMQGMGWINTTLMFYGSYSSKILIMPTDSFYNMPLAYFLVGTLSFLIVLLLILWSASSIIEDNYIKDGVKHYNSYSNKVFGVWDYCVTDEDAARLKVKSFVRDLEGDLAEDLRLENLSQRTRNETIKIYAIRITINLIVLLLSVGAGYAIYQAAQLSLKTAQNDVNSKSSKTEIIDLLKSYASSITLTVLNSMLPTLFYFFSRLEDWNPRAQVNIDLARTVLLKLSSVAVLLISLFEKINKDECILCWENAIAAEMYKLIWMDFLVVVAVALFYHTPRRYVADHIDLGIKLGQKIGRPIFFIPQNVLELVYAQCLIWIGMWYSPLLTLMGCVKLFILFYVKKLTLKYNCQSEDKAYRAGKSNYFFMLLLLATFFLCVAAVVYGVSQIRPSLLYGPFRGLDRMYRIVPLTIQTLPIGFQDIYKVVQSPVFVIGIVILICLGLYFFYASAKVYNRMITELREELAMETRDKKYLLKKLSAS